MKIGVVHITVGFGLMFAVVLVGAWATAEGTRGPWYQATESYYTYSVSTVGATLMLVALLVFIVFRRQFLEKAIFMVEDKISAGLQEVAVAPPLSEQEIVAKVSTPPIASSVAEEPVEKHAAKAVAEEAMEEDIEALLESLAEEGEEEAQPEVVELEETAVEPAREEELTEVAVQAAGEESHEIAELEGKRRDLERSKARVLWGLVGPVVMSAAILAVSAAMLPGSDGFAQSHYKLNTTLVLFVSYGWLALAFYAAASVYYVMARPKPSSIFS